MPSLTLEVPHRSDVARKILAEIRSRVRMTESRASSKWDKWRKAEETVGLYVTETEVDRVRKAEREGGAPTYTTVQIPYTYAVLMAAHTYFTSVFMARSPIFQYQARHGETAQQIQAIEALMDYQVGVGQLLGPLYTWLHDAGKYGAGILGNWWEDRYETISSVQMQQQTDFFGNPVGAPVKMHNLARGKTYSGNRLYNVQPWDFIWDTRYPIRDFQKGEYCGVRRKLAWNELKRREKAGYYYNLENIPKANHSEHAGSFGASGLDRPDLYDSGTQWADHTDGFGTANPKTPEIIELVIDIIPEEWRLSENDWPEKWVFTCTSDYSCLIGVQPHGALHSKFPYQVLTLEAEAYGLVPKGMPETLEPIQQTIDWLVNSHFYNVRAALNNRLVVDPSRVVMKDVLNPLPGGAIRLKPTAFGQDIKMAVHQLQVVDVTQNHLRDLQMMYGMGERTMGVNDQIMGMLSTGGRKTATEVRTSTSFGVNRLKTIAEYFSATGFDPLSMMMLQNTQQYYDAVQKFRIAGDLTNTAGLGFIQVDPTVIQGAYNFVPVDGTLPIDRYAQANLWKEILFGLKQMPEIALQYDTARIFEWVAQLAGLKNITQFKLQVAPDPMLLQMAKLGNVIPIGGRKPGQGGGGKPPAGGAQTSEPAQIPGMGQTG